MIGIVLGILIAVVVIFIIALLVLVTAFIMKKTYSKRADGSVSIIYPLPSELRNIEINKGYIKSKGNTNLAYYTYKNPNTTPKALILVIHGIGFGHFYLLPLIQKFVDDGYMVLSYDQYASGSSEGKTFKTMARGSVDIKYVLKFIESNSAFSNMPLYVFGHSWGGYVAGFSLRYSKSIVKCVDVSGFDNECDFAQRIKLLIYLRNFFVCGFNSFVRIRSIFHKTTAKILYLQGEDDLVVNPQFAGKMYKKILGNKPNIAVEMLKNKGHTPFDDIESETKQKTTMREFGSFLSKLPSLESYVDFRKISIVDEEIYQKILNFYESEE